MVLTELDAVFVINPDCRLRKGTLSRLAAALAEDPRRGIAAPRLINPDGSLQPSLRRAPTIRRALAEGLLGKAAARIGTLGELLTKPSDYDHPRQASWATGAAMFVSTKVITAIGPWDERFLLYSEETEFALRAADHGFRLWYEPAAVVEHIGGQSSINPQLYALLTVNKVVLYRMRHGRVASGAFYLVVLLGEALRALAGRTTSRAATIALLRPSRRMRALPGG
jgi:GT2 family glycosyltransferase